MLRKETVKDTTFELLKKLQGEKLLENNLLVGGTSLSLQIGHRISEDLDLFTNETFDKENIIQMLDSNYGFIPRIINDYTIIGEIKGIKIDIIYHPFKWLNPSINEDGVRLADKKDLTAMKLHAIINSGKRPKDFVDIAYLSQFYCYDGMKQLLMEKYPAYDPIMADRAISFFGDIDINLLPSIKMTRDEFNFERIKKRILNMTDEPFKIFENAPLHPKNIKKLKVGPKL